MIRKVIRFLLWFPLVVIVIGVAEGITTGKLSAQQRHADMNLELVPKIDSSRPRVVRLTPAPIYAHWWQEIAQCEGLPIKPQIDSVRFYAVNGSQFQATVDGKVLTVIGEARPDDNEIFVVVSLIADEALLKHEMLHFLLAWDGYRFKNFHPVEYFEKCGIHRAGP